MDFRDLLKLYQVPENASMKLYRHAGDTGLLKRLHLSGELEEYQRIQAEKRLECDLVAFFLGLPRNQGLFTGIYSPSGSVEVPDYHERAALSDEPAWKFGPVIYDLQKTGHLAPLEDRAVIDFGPPVRTAHRWLDKIGALPVTEIRPEGRGDAFPGYSLVRLSFRQLCQILGNPSANQDWKNALSSLLAFIQCS